ncbi:hypothetical protein QBC47DRAFT_378589 [Echria macrotheca]|uniref:Uncharacterized protein n=1 Tax=Echria macrotheca TaxID=438768 RepID=A0AAJ0BF81_9PEZI|nr:hypothetical protein QBC47DRAFT_378589 [Echria macrotheca]
MDDNDRLKPGTSASSRSMTGQMPGQRPPCPIHPNGPNQIITGPVFYVPGVIRPGPGNRPVFVPGPGPGIPAYLHGQQALGPTPPGSPPGSSSATLPGPLMFLRPQSQSQSVQSFSDAESHARTKVQSESETDFQSATAFDSKAKLKGPERRSPLGFEPGADVQPEPKGPEATEKEVTREPALKGWRPRWLRRPVLVVFAVWFVVLVAGTESMFYLSNRDEGIAADPPPNMFYLWTMGPPAVFALTTLVWDRVNYQAMRLMPWIQLSNEPSGADQSIALDYHSQLFSPVLFITALRNRHYIVACGTAVALLLRVLTVLSTGMIFFEPSAPDGVTGRLLVQPIFLHITAGILALQAILCMVMTVGLGQPEMPPANPETIMGMALDLMHSTKLLRKLSGTGHLTRRQTRRLLSGTYRTIQRSSSHNVSTDSLIPPTFTVSCAPESQGALIPALASMEPESGAGGTSSYTPPILRLLPRILASVVLLAMIGVVVGLSQISRGLPPGFTDVPGDPISYTHYLWTSVPTALAVCASLYFSALDSQIRAHAGFLFLQKGQANAQQLTTNLGDRLPTTAFVKGLGMGAWSVVSSSVAAVLGLLLCVVSGTVFIVDANAGRLLVNEVGTYMMIGVLAALFLLNLSLLGLLPRRMTAAKAPGSILGMASLLADSNIFERFPLAVEYMSSEGVCELFGEEAFRLGWFEKPEGGGMNFGIGVIEDMD